MKIPITAQAFDEIEGALTADYRFSKKEDFPSLFFYTPDGKEVVFYVEEKKS